MRNTPDSEWEIKELSKLNAEPWMMDLLAMNPSYTSWGPHEDYMIEEEGWGSRIINDTWQDFEFSLDDLNEVVNFYFEVRRESRQCDSCDGNGYHPDAQEVVNSFYRHMNPLGEHWDDKITQDEVDALWNANRLQCDFKEKPSASEVNTWQRGRGIGHDGINKMILIEQRLKRLGLPKTCPECDGDGYIYTAPSAHVSLILWILHPRKGCSRGGEITRITQADLPEVFAYLRQAANRNAERFSRIP